MLKQLRTLSRDSSFPTTCYLNVTTCSWVNISRRFEGS